MEIDGPPDELRRHGHVFQAHADGRPAAGGQLGLDLAGGGGQQRMDAAKAPSITGAEIVPQPRGFSVSFAQTCRIRSRVTPNSRPTSVNVRCRPSRQP